MNSMTDCCKRSNIENENVKVFPSNFYLPPPPGSKKLKNRIRTTKYRFYNFIFLNLFEQFKRYSNLFFIFCIILNFIPGIGAFNQGTAVIPILFILIVTLIKDGVEDLRRYFSDRNVNNRTVLRYEEVSNEFYPCKWKDILVGDLVKISSCERIPADLLIYHSSDPTGICFIETMDIDGETTLKQRFIMKSIDKYSTNMEKAFKHYEFEVEAPNREIYKFKGKLYDHLNDRSGEHLNCTNLILRDTILRNTDEVRGLVIYAGNQTKVFMNNKKARFKRSLLEDQLNVDMLMCLGMLIIVCMMTGIGSSLYATGFNNITNVIFIVNSTMTYNIYLGGFKQFWTSVIVFQSIIPIALYITLEFVKAHQVLHITNDIALYNESLNKKIDVKAYNITEDLGQIKQMFCDKTGTLTDNEMIFRRASIFGRNYKTRENNLKLCDIEDREDLHKNKHVSELLLLSAICNTTIISKTSKREKKLVHVDTSSTLLTNLSLNNNAGHIKSIFNYEANLSIECIPPITIEDIDPIPKDLAKPEFEKPESINSTSSYTKSNITAKTFFYRQLSNDELAPLILSESPDEDALVRMVMYNGYALHQRTNDTLIIWNDIKHSWITYEILKTLPFDSIRKCMSVIVKDLKTNEITLNCKGADSVMFPKMVANSEIELEVIAKTKADIHEFASDGLRTLVMGKRVLQENEYKKWEEVLLKSEDCLVNNENEIKEVYDLLETKLDLVGAIGLEDKLQEFVPEIIECFKEAGINIWILTGDKKETAISIAYSTKLFSINETLVEISCENEVEIINEISQIRMDIENSLLDRKSQINEEICKHEEFVLVIDGSSLSVILTIDDLKDEFLHIAYFCNSVVCCRCTPIQKGEVVNLVKNKFRIRTLAIGDGANDVNMIQTADIGIGVSGKEGSQATLASDFAITKFKYLKRLVLVHGHWSYDKLARMSLILFYKNVIISMVMFFYQVLCGFSNSQAIDQVTQLVFHLIHTGLPPIIFGTWDKDFSDEILMANPQIYLTGINSKMYRPRDFWRTILDAIWQALVIFIVPSLCYWNTEISMGEFGIVSVSCVIIAMFSHIIIESRHWSPFHWAICIGSLAIGVYLELFIVNVICVVLFDCNTDNPYKVLHYTMSKGKTYVIIALTTAISLFPRLFAKGLLMESRESVFYEAHRRITKMGIPKWTTNIIKTIPHDPHIFDYKNSKFYLGNLEEFKKLKCDKCQYRNYFINKEQPFSFAKYRKNQVLPRNI